jgi:hypothetical protein
LIFRWELFSCRHGIVVCTALEDRTLHAELTGYAVYAARVRFRLISGRW